MGSCHSIHLLYSDYYNTNNNYCIQCKKEISENYIWCKHCRIKIHLKCIKKDKMYKNINLQKCPNCKNKKLYIYP